MDRLENRAVRNDVLIPGVDQAAIKKKLVRTGNAFFRRNAERSGPATRLSLLVSRGPRRLCSGDGALLMQRPHLPAREGPRSRRIAP